MTQKNSRRPSKNRRKRKSSGSQNFKKIFICAALFFLLIISVCAVGYVIFFRTVFAQEILPVLRSAIVFEEPNPPVQSEPAEPPAEAAEPKAPENPAVAIEPTEKMMPGEPVGKDHSLKKSRLPKVAIIIDDMGYDETTGQRLLDLPFEMTYSFLPFAPYTRKLEEIAHHAGKILFLHLPLQPKGTFSPGPGALFLQDSPELQRMKLNKCLEEVPYAVGVNNHMGSAFTENERAMKNIIEGMKGRLSIFIDSYTSPGSVAYQVALAASMKSARRNVFLDNVQDEQKICGQLEKLADIAEKKGRAIGIAHPHPATANALAECGAKYQRRVQYVNVLEVLTDKWVN